MRVWFLILGMVIVATAQEPATSRSVPPVPKIVCEKPEGEFGDIGDLEELVYGWEIKNGGTADLIIDGVFCKHGWAAIDRPKLQPGGTGLVSLRKTVGLWPS